jgi:hypothetical protein
VEFQFSFAQRLGIRAHRRRIQVREVTIFGLVQEIPAATVRRMSSSASGSSVTRLYWVIPASA